MKSIDLTIKVLLTLIAVVVLSSTFIGIFILEDTFDLIWDDQKGGPP